MSILLKAAAGELVASLWSQAQEGAQESLAAFRLEAQELVANSQQACKAADQARVAAQTEVNQTRGALRDANERILQLERNLAAESARTQSLEQQIEAAGRQQISLEAALAEARRDYSAELEKSRVELRRSEERLAANEKRALMEIDHERQMTAKIQRDLQQLRENWLISEERQRNDLAASKSELVETRQKLGVAEGKQNELRGVVKQQLEELSVLRQSQARVETQLALLQREVELTQEAKLLQASKPTTPRGPRRNRKLSI